MNLIQKILLESELGDENEFDLNLIFQPNPNQLERYKQELERRKQELERLRKEFEENLSKIKLGLKEINKAFENKEWESKEEELFLKSFYNCKIKVNLKKYPNIIFITKNGKVIAYQNLKSKWLMIDYKSIWMIFQNKFHWNYDKTQSFMKIMLNKYFKLREYKPGLFTLLNNIS